MTAGAKSAERWAGQLERKAWGRTARKRKLEKTVRMVQAGQEREDRMTEGKAAATGQQRWDNCGWTATTVKLDHDVWDTTTAMTVCLDRSAQQISRDRSAMTGQRGQDAWT
jgi:hypothetical protein